MRRCVNIYILNCRKIFDISKKYACDLFLTELIQKKSFLNYNDMSSDSLKQFVKQNINELHIFLNNFSRQHGFSIKKF